MEKISLTVNGDLRIVEVNPETPLLFVLRNNLRLKGTKLGCTLEQCGACAVLVNGEKTLSCVRHVKEFEDTNRMFETPKKIDKHITRFLNDEEIIKLAKEIQ